MSFCSPFISVVAVVILVFVSCPASAEVEEPPAPLEVVVRLRAKSAAPGLKSLAPYRECLVVYEYEVMSVKKGRHQGKTIRVTHYAWFDGHEQSITSMKLGGEATLMLRPLESLPSLRLLRREDTLGKVSDEPLYHDVGQPLRRPKPSRHGYGAGMTQPMRMLRALRGQVRLIAWGDSRTHQGVDGGAFFRPQNDVTPIALNLATPSCELDLLEVLVLDYTPHLPRLEWVVIGLAPRMVNNRWDNSLAKDFQGSGGYRDDVKSDFEHWRGKSAGVVTLRQMEAMRGINWKEAPYGAPPAGKEVAPDYARNGGFLRLASRTQWDWADRRWLQLGAIVRSLRERGVQVLIFTPPTHPAFAQSKSIDEDATPREAAEQLVSRLKQWSREDRGVHTLDINQGARHGMSRTLFRDRDHTNLEGRAHLSKRLAEYVERADKRGKPPVRKPPLPIDQKAHVKVDGLTDGLGVARLKPRTRMYVDRKYEIDKPVDQLAGAQVIQTRNDDRQLSSKDAVAFTIDRPSRIWLAINDSDETLPAWMLEWRYCFATQPTALGDFRLYARDFEEGRVILPGAADDVKDNYIIFVQPLQQK